ncbi:hypothetical protein [Bacillus sp. FJAT-47783]|uniref:hypothetical protein n=1 Tax=Bacillus sp. FJAT-47783 TaxID=2922712 RepID=UPI001FAD2957|nr:hypothetical protein [Bacillus sp. FJAT-47783]
MDMIQLSIEELIFSFYSDGLYEQGVSLKETYFPNLKDYELRFMLEMAARSLLAKNMVEEAHHQYKLKDEVKPYIHALNDANRTIKASKFFGNLEDEQSITFHTTDQNLFMHQLLHDHQIHQVGKISKEKTRFMIYDFFQFDSLKKECEESFTMKNEEYEKLLEKVSQDETQCSLEQIDTNLKGNPLFEAFLDDLSVRKGKMDSILYMEYDQDNLPNIVDLLFIVPGKKETWFISRGNYNEFVFQKANEKTLQTFLFERNSMTV